MIKTIMKVIYVMVHIKLLKKLISMPFSGYFYEIGWFKSFEKQLPVDKDELPLPWVTYGFIDFIAERLNERFDVFEYGSGNSTKWYSRKVRSVTSVEHDKEWFDFIKDGMPSNVDLKFQDLEYGGDYSNTSGLCGKKFDLIVVDGRDRVNCVKHSISSLKSGGVIVLDDSERSAYSQALRLLKESGFRRIDFWGISPGLFYKKNTTIFYKSDNCLGI
ncbi:MAG: hypothetical protein ACPG4B_06905 [Cycloclasticus sp.]